MSDMATTEKTTKEFLVQACVNARTLADAEQQVKEINEYCTERKWTITNVIYNRDWLHLSNLVKEGKITALIAAKVQDLPFMYEDELDRLKREIQQIGGEIYTVHHGII